MLYLSKSNSLNSSVNSSRGGANSLRERRPLALRLRNDLYCVEWGVKLYSLTPPGSPWLPVTASGYTSIALGLMDGTDSLEFHIHISFALYRPFSYKYARMRIGLNHAGPKYNREIDGPEDRSAAEKVRRQSCC